MASNEYRVNFEAYDKYAVEVDWENGELRAVITLGKLTFTEC